MRVLVDGDTRLIRSVVASSLSVLFTRLFRNGTRDASVSHTGDGFIGSRSSLQLNLHKKDNLLF
jgi:hypothetical protein